MFQDFEYFRFRETCTYTLIGFEVAVIGGATLTSPLRPIEAGSFSSSSLFRFVGRGTLASRTQSGYREKRTGHVARNPKAAMLDKCAPGGILVRGEVQLFRCLPHEPLIPRSMCLYSSKLYVKHLFASFPLFSVNQI